MQENETHYYDEKQKKSNDATKILKPWLSSCKLSLIPI